MGGDSFLMSPASMAVCAADFAFFDFGNKPFQADPVANHVCNICLFRSANVVKFQNNRVIFGAVNARMVFEVALNK